MRERLAFSSLCFQPPASDAPTALAAPEKRRSQVVNLVRDRGQFWGAFGDGAFYADRRTIQTDGEMSSVVAKKTLGKEVAIGPGKQNKSALQKQVRSAKKS